MKSILSERHRLRTAIHEAGHAVMAFIHGRVINTLTIRVEGLKKGSINYRTIEGDGVDEIKSKEWIQVIMGGAAADIVFQKMFSFGALDDVRCAREVAAAFVPESEEFAYVMRLRVIAEETLAQPRYWGVVQAVAKALLRDETMNGDQVIAVIKSTMGDNPEDV